MSSLLFLLVFPGETYLARNDFGDAQRYYQLLASIAPSYDAYYHTAVCALINGELVTCVEMLRSLPYKDAEAYYYLGVAYYQLQHYDTSAYFFQLSLEKDTTIWQSNYYQGLIGLKHNDVENAMEFFSRTPHFSHRSWLLDYIEDYNSLERAVEKYKEGKYSDVIDIYKEVDYFVTYRDIGLALAYAKTEEYRVSIMLFDSIIANSTDELLVTRSTLEAAHVSYKLDDVSRTRQYLDDYILIGEHDDAWFLYGLTYSDESWYDSAIVYFEGLPDSVDEYLFHKGRTHYFLGFWAKAEEELLRHREHFSYSPNGDRATFIIASINYKRKEYDHAISFWNDLVLLYPKSIYTPAAQKGIGDAYYEKADYHRALGAYRLVDQFNPSLSIAERTILRIYETRYHLGEFSDLLVALKNYVDDYPNSQLLYATRLRIAKILYDNRDYYQSLSEINRLIEECPDSSITYKALIEKAEIFQALGNFKEVRKVYGLLLVSENAGEHHSYAADKLGTIYYNEAKYDSALYYYNLLLGDEKYREKALYEIATVYDLLGQDREAETIIDQLIHNFPTSVFLFDAYMIKVRIYKKQGYYEKAVDLLKDLVKKVGQKSEIYIEIGHLYFETEDYSEARKFYLIACEYFRQRRDDAAMALMLAGDASCAIGDRKSAREYYLQATLIANSLSLKNKATARLNSIGED